MTKPETEKMLPCPHCGGASTVHTEGWDAAQFIRCTECSANTRLFKTREEAVAAWNRRPKPEAIGYIGLGELKRLKEGAYHATIYPNAAAGFVPIYTDLPMIRAQGGGVTPDAAPDAKLVDDLNKMAYGYLPDGDGVDMSVALWAEQTLTRIAHARSAGGEG